MKLEQQQQRHYSHFRAMDPRSGLSLELKARLHAAWVLFVCMNPHIIVRVHPFLLPRAVGKTSYWHLPLIFLYGPPGLIRCVARV